MSDQSAAVQATSAPAPAPNNDAIALELLGYGAASEQSSSKTADSATKEPASAAHATQAAEDDEASDPLAEELYSEDKLKTPEDIAKARGRLFRYLGKVNELQRKANRAHGAAATREDKLKRRETEIVDREKRVELVERTQSKAIEDLTSGDTQRFLTAVANLTRSGDPAGFWRDASIALAKGEALKPKQQAQADANPELARRLEALEGVMNRDVAMREATQIETLKTQHLQFAQKSEAHPHLSAFAAAHPEDAREGIAAVMLEEFQRIGRAVDISTACGIIEKALAAKYELSPRADGKTNGEKATTGFEPDAGRETSKEPPKPETAKAPATIPAALASAPGSANRARTPEEEREWQIRELERLGFF